MGMVQLELKTPGELLSEITRLRAALTRIQAVLMPHDDAKHVSTVGRAREIALSALNDLQ